MIITYCDIVPYCPIEIHKTRPPIFQTTRFCLWFLNFRDRHTYVVLACLTTGSEFIKGAPGFPKSIHYWAKMSARNSFYISSKFRFSFVYTFLAWFWKEQLRHKHVLKGGWSGTATNAAIVPSRFSRVRLANSLGTSFRFSLYFWFWFCACLFSHCSMFLGRHRRRWAWLMWREILQD